MTDADAKSNDPLLWIAAAVVVLMGLTWLVIEAPWSTPDGVDAALSANARGDAAATAGAADPVADALPGAAVAGTAGAGPASAPAEDTNAGQASRSAAGPGSDPLHLAELALAAGMLIEPPDYSAWSLYGRVANEEPGNAAARAGLEAVATALLGRGAAALEQGRYDDAIAIVETILERLPDHAEALALGEAVAVAAAPPPPPPVERRPEAETVAEDRPPPVDPVPALNDSFFAAMAANSVLTPPGTSAVDIVGEMLAAAPEHALTTAARDMLVTEMLDRSLQSLEARDIAAARTWIDSAAPLAADRARIEEAEYRLTRHLIETESQKLLPASSFTQTHYIAPEYPRLALDRGIEGWVDLEFVISARGETESVRVIDASNERYFGEEAIATVEQWRFEPDIFMGEPIARRSHTRLVFVLD